MKLQTEGKNLKITVELQDLGRWKGLDRNGNCYFKFDFSDRSGQTVALRVPAEIGREIILLMRDELIKFLERNQWSSVLNSKEKIEFQELKRTLVDNKDITESFSLKKSLGYNKKYFGKIGEKINEIELKQEESLCNEFKFMKELQKNAYLKLKAKNPKMSL